MDENDHGEQRQAVRKSTLVKIVLSAWTLIIISTTVISPSPAPAQSQPGQRQGASTKPASNLEYWLSHAKPVRKEPATTTRTTTKNTSSLTPGGDASPANRVNHFRRPDALPGVIILSDGKLLPGGIYTTRDKDWIVYVESEKRWRHIPILVLSISAIVVEEGMEKEFRWKEMGRNEKILTGRKKPVRRFLWRLHLIDDSYVTGTIKGQPVWVEQSGKRLGPFVLHERQAGKYGQSLNDLVYIKRIIISREAMVKVKKLANQPSRSK